MMANPNTFVLQAFIFLLIFQVFLPWCCWSNVPLPSADQRETQQLKFAAVISFEARSEEPKSNNPSKITRSAPFESDISDHLASPAEFLALKHESRILRQSSNPECGFSLMEQVRLCAVWPTENWHASSRSHIQGCLRMLMICFRKKMSGGGFNRERYRYCN